MIRLIFVKIHSFPLDQTILCPTEISNLSALLPTIIQCPPPPPLPIAQIPRVIIINTLRSLAPLSHYLSCWQENNSQQCSVHPLMATCGSAWWMRPLQKPCVRALAGEAVCAPVTDLLWAGGRGCGETNRQDTAWVRGIRSHPICFSIHPGGPLWTPFCPYALGT